MATIRNPDDIDPRVLEEHARMGWPVFRPGDRIRHPDSGEVGVVVRTWWNETLSIQDLFICFDDGGNPFADPADCKPYMLRYGAPNMERVEEGQAPPPAWEDWCRCEVCDWFGSDPIETEPGLTGTFICPECEEDQGVHNEVVWDLSK